MFQPLAFISARKSQKHGFAYHGPASTHTLGMAYRITIGLGEVELIYRLSDIGWSKNIAYRLQTTDMPSLPYMKN